MVELHSNFTASGTKAIVDGVLPTNHAEHETLEITHGFSEWFETGFYQFTSIQPDGSLEWVGTHIRPRIAVPESYQLPVGLSMSVEIRLPARRSSRPTPGPGNAARSSIRKSASWYAALNPTFDRSFHGRGAIAGFEFSPNVKFSYDVTKKVALGVEYYGSLRPGHRLGPGARPAAADLARGGYRFRRQNWEFNFGVGSGRDPGHGPFADQGDLGLPVQLQKQRQNGPPMNADKSPISKHPECSCFIRVHRRSSAANAFFFLASTQAGNTSGFSSHTSIHCAISSFCACFSGVLRGLAARNWRGPWRRSPAGGNSARAPGRRPPAPPRTPPASRARTAPAPRTCAGGCRHRAGRRAGRYRAAGPAGSFPKRAPGAASRSCQTASVMAAGWLAARYRAAAV